MKTPFLVQTFAQISDQPALSGWLIEQSRLKPDQRLYALVDGAQVDQLSIALEQLAPQDHTSMFDALGKPEAREAGPWLMAVDMHPGDPRLEYTCEVAMMSHGVLWFLSDLRLPELAKLLAPRMNAKLERGPEVHFRYYDSRTFTELVPILKAEQVPFLAFASSWFWINHTWERCSLEVPMDLEAARAFEPPLVLDPEQEKIFLHGSLPYEVMGILEENAPQALEPVPLMDRYSILKKGVDQAQAEGKRRLSELRDWRFDHGFPRNRYR